MTIRDLIERAKREEYLTVKQYAVLFQYAEKTIHRKLRRGEIPGVIRTGRKAIRIHNPAYPR